MVSLQAVGIARARCRWRAASVPSSRDPFRPGHETRSRVPAGRAMPALARFRSGRRSSGRGRRPPWVPGRARTSRGPPPGRASRTAAPPTAAPPPLAPARTTGSVRLGPGGRASAPASGRPWGCHPIGLPCRQEGSAGSRESRIQSRGSVEKQPAHAQGRPGSTKRPFVTRPTLGARTLGQQDCDDRSRPGMVVSPIVRCHPSDDHDPLVSA